MCRLGAFKEYERDLMFSKKVLSGFLAVVLVFSMVPASVATQAEVAYAEPGSEAGSAEQTEGSGAPAAGSGETEGTGTGDAGDSVDKGGSGSGDEGSDPSDPAIDIPDDGEDGAEDEAGEDEGTDDRPDVVRPSEGIPDLSLDSDPEMDLEPLAAVAPGLSPGVYVFRSALARNLVIDVEKGSSARRANVRTWTSNMTMAQRFEISFDEKGYATIKNANSGKVLDVAGGKGKPRTNVWQYVPNNSRAQKWIVHANSDGTYTFESALKKGLVLDVAGGSTASGANLQIYGSNNTYSQKFYALDPTVDIAAQGRTISDGTYTIATALDTKKVVDIAGASMADSTTAQIYNTNGTLAQKFQVKLNSRGYYTIRAYHSGKALTAERGNIVPSTRVIQKAYDANDKAQDWIITPAAAGGYTIMARTGLVMDVQGGSSKAKTAVWLYGNNGSKAQRWNFSAEGGVKLAEGVCTIKPFYTSKVFDIAGGSKSQNANVQIYRSNNSLAQRYLCTKVADGVYTFQALNSGRYLSESNGNLVQQKYTGNNSQKWRVELALGGYVFYNMKSGNVMTVAGNGTADKCNVAVSAFSSAKGQKFSISSANSFPNGYYKISEVSTGKAVEVAKASNSKGANVRAYTANGKNEQKWYVTNLGNDWYKISAAVSGFSLDVAGGAAKTGSNVRQWHWNGTAAQKWKAVPSGDGNFYFKSALGDLYLGVSSGSNVCLHTSNIAKAQKFKLTATTYTPVKPVPADQRAMNNRVSGLASPTGWLLAIDSTTCKVGVYKGSKGNWTNVFFWSCGPGASSTPTVKGLYSVGSRGYSFGSGYTCYYWTQFYGNYLFHSVLYNQGTRTIQDGTLGKRVSHGCVRLDINNAKWIYDNIPSGTTVLSY